MNEDLDRRTDGGLRRELEALLEAVADGDLAPASAAERFAEFNFVDLGFARVDIHRELRQGVPEAVLAEGKTPRQVAKIVASMREAGSRVALVTRADPDVRRAVREIAPEAQEDARARAIWVGTPPEERRGRIAMISAGTADGPVIQEARVTAELVGADVSVHEDVGVAGLQRLAALWPEVRDADCIVVAAGMDAALASVVGGLARCAVIGVPTSAGYGSAAGGWTALNAMLASCAAGLAVVGIDDGFGAGSVAARIARATAGT